MATERDRLSNVSDLRPLPQPVSNDIGAVNLPSADAGPLSDALLRILQQLPHGAWSPALAERGLPVETTLRIIRLRQRSPQKRQIVVFDNVSAALAVGKTRASRPIKFLLMS